MKYILLSITTIIFIATYATSVHAGEIQYGSLKDQRGDILLLEYKGPSGPQYFTCDLDDDACKERGTTTPKLFPSLLGSTVYPKSADGRLAVKPFVVGTMVYHFLYNISGNEPKKIALIPYIKKGATVHFTKNNDAVVFKQGNNLTRYDIATKKLSSITLPQSLAFFSLSPSATYATGYNYGTLHHEIWRFADEKKFASPSSMQSYLEFSEDESRLTFLEDVDSFKTLYTMKTSELGKKNPTSLTQLTKPSTETEDYLYIDDTLYFLANVDGPLEWDLWSHDGEDTILVDEDVSYGDFLKRVRDTKKSYLAYLKTTGKNTNVILVSPDSETKRELKAVKASSASTKVTREVVEYGKRTGVLLSPSEQDDDEGDLFIWMHGGPQRQVAKAYHPYLSYAVYDELMERLIGGGNYVFKIDYTGSSGYGADFRKALSMKIGDVEIDDIKNTIADIKKDKDVDDVFLIGNSYGGYMALRGIVDMPKAVDGAISINGVSDWYGLIQAIPSSPFRKLFNGVPDTTNLDAYFKASVFLGMEDLTKRDKVLVVWGEEDATVPTSQSENYITYAKTQGVRVDELSFPNEGHILRERKNLDSLCDKITSFFKVSGVECKL